MKRSIAFSRTLNLMRIRERFHFQQHHHHLIIGTQNNNRKHLHHVILERRRRENENQCFRELRALLPPGTKKHKASVLVAAKEALKSLVAEIEKLNIRNQELETLLVGSSSSSYVNVSNFSSSSSSSLNVAVLHVPGSSSSSEERMVDLQVAVVRGESSSHDHDESDIVIRLLEFLKSLHNQLSFVSMATNSTINTTQGTTLNQINFRIRIHVSEWDEPGFVEAVTRIVADLLPY
ncbi:hypothetical protein PIB30_086093 [Stylosanthes scabra]|uniref:BHLH domain-containing protein n=1 Tax=Stylosanthes scabra TaxID=79078 RepID=A0ABU6UWR7_9FABA|nr:hypothetical protein [Stylosanthes scabra]